MTDPRDDFERRFEADLRAYLNAGTPRIDPARTAEQAMAARPSRSL
jgi:hypothetical protein